jgi:hypothetical protein
MADDTFGNRSQVYEIMPFRSVWILRRRGAREEVMFPTREEAIDRAETLRRSDAAAELVITEPDGGAQGYR